MLVAWAACAGLLAVVLVLLLQLLTSLHPPCSSTWMLAYILAMAAFAIPSRASSRECRENLAATSPSCIWMSTAISRAKVVMLLLSTPARALRCRPGSPPRPLMFPITAAPTTLGQPDLNRTLSQSLPSLESSWIHQTRLLRQRQHRQPCQ